MKLEKLLAENMLRFGVKNLNNTNVQQILTIVEQAAAVAGKPVPKTYEEFAALDAPEVVATPGYKELFTRLFEIQAGKGNGYNNSEKQATESIGWWTNSPQLNKQQSNAKNFTDNVIKNLAAAIAALESVKAGKITARIEDIDNRLKLLKDAKSKLDSLITNNIYITNWNPYNSTNDKIYALSTQTYAWDDPKVISSRTPFTSELTKFVKNADGESSPGKQIYTKQTFSAIPNDIKIKLVQESVQKARNSGKPISKADRIFVGPKNTAALYSKTTVTNPTAEAAPQALPISYPPKDPTDPLVQNFFGDDQYQVSSEQQASFTSMLQQAVEFCKTSGTILEVKYQAGSSTSTVPTSFKGGNAALTDARLGSIETVLASTIAANPDLQGVKVTKLGAERHVEVGPPYNKAKYSLDKRKADPVLKAEYDKIYGPYRGSYGEFIIIYQPKADTSTEPDSTVEYTPVGNWAIKVDWNKIRFPEINLPNIGIMPKQKPFNASNFNPTACWKG